MPVRSLASRFLRSFSASPASREDAAHNSVAKRLADFRAGAPAGHERHGSEGRRHRAHENRPEAQKTRLCMLRGHGVVPLRVHSKVNQQVRVLLYDRDAQENADDRDDA